MSQAISWEPSSHVPTQYATLVESATPCLKLVAMEGMEGWYDNPHLPILGGWGREKTDSRHISMIHKF